MILVTYSSVTAEKEANVGEGESGAMCQKLSEVEKIECIFSIFSVKNSTNLSAKSFGGFIDGRIFAGILCNTLHYINIYIAPIKLSALQYAQYTVNA